MVGKQNRKPVSCDAARVSADVNDALPRVEAIVADATLIKELRR